MTQQAVVAIWGQTHPPSLCFPTTSLWHLLGEDSQGRSHRGSQREPHKGSHGRSHTGGAVAKYHFLQPSWLCLFWFTSWSLCNGSLLHIAFLFSSLLFHFLCTRKKRNTLIKYTYIQNRVIYDWNMEVYSLKHYIARVNYNRLHAVFLLLFPFSSGYITKNGVILVWILLSTLYGNVNCLFNSYYFIH